MKINSITQIPNTTLQHRKEQQSSTPDAKEFVTSIYNNKGVTLPFCALAKGQNATEEYFIKMLRKLRDGRCRKFTENDISEIITDLRKIPQKEDKEQLLKDVLSLKNEETGESPDRFFLKRLIHLVSGRSENERYAIMDYALNDLSTATEPLAVFSRLPEQTKNRLAGILTNINNLNEQKFYTTDSNRKGILEGLYDHFRVVLYAYDDVKKLPVQKSKAYKLDALSNLHSDLKFFENSNAYAGKEAKTKVCKTAKKIYNFFIENFI